MVNIVLSMITLFIAVKGSVSVNRSLESIPPSMNGVLTACAGHQISLTCSHDVEVSRVVTTVWKASPLVNCSTVVNHNSPSILYSCGPFMVDRITGVNVEPFPLVVNSTAMATAAVNMTNTTIECVGGSLTTESIGNISLCIVAPPPPPTGITCIDSTNGLNITWEPVIDTSCAMSNVTYLVTATAENDMTTIIESDLVTETRAELTNTMGLQPATGYNISVRAVTISGSCEGQQAMVTCETSPVVTTPPATTTSRGLSAGAIAAIVVVFIVLIIVAVVIVIVVVIVIRIYPQGKRRDQDGVHDSLGGDQQVNPYAMVDKTTTQ